MFRQLKVKNFILSAMLIATMGIVFTTILVSQSFAQEVVRLSYWMQTEKVYNEAMKELIGEYERMYPNVKIAMDTAPHAEHVTKLRVALMGKGGPDFFAFPEREVPQLVLAEALAPPDYEALGVGSQEELIKKFAPGSLSSFIYNNRVYGLPAWVAIYSWAINKTHFKDAGLDPEINYPRTWDDVIEAGKKVKRVEAGRMVREPLTFPFNMAPAWYILGYQPILRQYGGEILNETHTKATINSPEGVKALQLWYDMVYKHKIISLERTTEHFDVEFAKGTISMWFGANWQAPTFERYNPAIKDHYKIIPFPVVSGGKRSVGTTCWGYMVNRVSKHQREAWKFLSFAMTRAAWYLKKTGAIMPVEGLAASPEAKAIPFFDIWMEDVKYGKPLLVTLHFSEIAQSVVQAIEKSLLNQMPPKESLDICAREIDKIVEKK